MRLLHSRTRIVAGWFLLVLGAACAGRTTAVEEEKAAPAIEVKAGARSWPMFGGSVQRNLAAPDETGLPNTWSVEEGKTKYVKWSAKLGSKALGGPIVAGGRIFVGTNHPHDSEEEEPKGVLLCFRESDGKFLWQAVHDALKDGTGAQTYGIVSSPCVDGERVYYVNNRWEVVCADVAGEGGKAKILWKLDMVKDLGVFPGGLQGSLSICSPIVVEDRVFVVTANGVDNKGKAPAPDAPSFLALDKNTGKVAWQDHSPGKNIMDGQWGNPAAAKVNGQWHVYFPGGDGWLYAFEAKTGKLVWKFDCNPKKSDFRPGGRGTRNYFVNTPVVWENKLYIATGRQPDDGNGEGHLWCIDITKTPKTAEKDLSSVGDNFDPKAEVNKDSGLVWHFGGPVVPKPQGAGREYVFGRSVSTVAIHDGLLYAAELAGYLNCLDARTGQKFWEFDLKASTWSSPLYADGKVYMGCDEGTMFVFTHGKESKKPAKIDMSEALLSPPTAVNGVLYVSNGTNLYAIAVK
ncbi:MAG TPA: PQQ-binding-like beta-propeller repeat protein [Gemmataceae bacterium]|nr:PQQ-binding-like beta-propeller repeat protein [Gemmataceae bacterium]